VLVALVEKRLFQPFFNHKNRTNNFCGNRPKTNKVNSLGSAHIWVSDDWWGYQSIPEVELHPSPIVGVLLRWR
jgi:hypothetical protein